MTRIFLLFLSLIFALPFAWADDGLPFQFQTQTDTYAIGDLHGDFNALVDILQQLHLVDDTLHWTGGNHQVVLLGDFFSGKHETRLILDLLLRLEREASLDGGGVHSVLGNHDLLVARGNLEKLSAAAQERFTQEPIDGARFTDAGSAIRTSKYGRWLATRNQVVLVNKILFSHAGVNPERMGDLSLATLNETFRAWIRAWLIQPSCALGWVVGESEGPANETGPSWYRGYKASEKRGKGAPKRKALRAYLASVHAEKMVIGHNPTPDSKALIEHPYYGDLVAMADTRISDEKNGRLMALKFDASGNGEVLKFKRSEDSPQLTSARSRYLNLRCSSVLSAR